MEFPPEMQATLITLLNASVSFIIFKMKAMQGKAAAQKRRADAVCSAVDEALRDDGTISKGEIERIKRVAERAAGA